MHIETRNNLNPKRVIMMPQDAEEIELHMRTGFILDDPEALSEKNPGGANHEYRSAFQQETDAKC